MRGFGVDPLRRDDDWLLRMKRLNRDGMWDWVFESVQRATDRGDVQRQMMVRLLTDGGEGMDGEFDRGLEALNRGRAIAQRLDEAWWTVLFDHWRLQLLLKKGEYPLARELVMHLVAEVRKPRYDGLPLRVCIQEDLIRICTETDPEGYTPRIEQALKQMERSVTPGTHCHHCLYGIRVDFARELGRWAEAEQILLELMELDADDPRSLPVHHTNLCRTAFERGDLEEARSWARSGEALGRKSDRADCIAECLAWQAYFAQAENPAEAARLEAVAMEAGTRIIGTPHPDFYDVICRYYDAAGLPDRALDARFAELKHLAGKGRLAREMSCRMAICGLLLQMGRPAKNQLAVARKVAKEFANPTPVLARLESLERGERTPR